MEFPLGLKTHLLFVFFMLPLLSGGLLKAQVGLREFDLELKDTLLTATFEAYNDGKDTSLSYQALLMVENTPGATAPVLIIFDTIFIARNQRLQIRKTYGLHSVMDSSYQKILYLTKNLPGNKLIVYHSFGAGEKQKVHRENNKAVIAKCRSVSLSDSTGQHTGLVFSRNIPAGSSPDSARIYLIPKEPDKRREEAFLLTTLLQDTLWINQRMPDNLCSGCNAFYYEVRIVGYPVCKSQTVLKKELRKLQEQEIPPDIDTSRELRPPLLIGDFEDPELKKLYKMPLVSGSIGSESKTQNYQQPYNYQPASYSRLYLQLNLGLPVIPLKVTTLLTTESSQQKSLNTFQVSFDRQAFEMQKMQRQAYLDHLLSSKKDGLEHKERRLRNDLFTKQEDLRKFDLQDSLLKTQADSLQGKIIQVLNDSLAQLEIRMKQAQADSAGQFSDSLGYEQDSAYAAMKAEKDSLLLRKEQSLAAIDSLKKAGAALTQQIETARQTADMLSQSLKTVKEGAADLTSLTRKLQQMKSGPKLTDYIKNIEVGRFTAGFSDLSVQGLQVQGALVKSKVMAMEVTGFYGKSSIPVLSHMPVAGKDLNYTRTSAGLQVSKRFTENNSVKINLVHLADPQKPATDPMLLKNNVFTVEPSVELLPQLVLSGEWGISSRKVYDLRVVSRGEEKHLAANVGMALASNLKYALEKQELVIGMGYRRINPDYYTAGNIFMRKNFEEYELSADKKFFTKKIRVKLNYKYNLDNLDRSKSFTTKMKGYGIVVNSQFKKAPNFFFSYMPFETRSSYTPNEFVSPASPSWLISYYTATRSAVLLFNLNHQWKFKEHLLNVSSGITRSSFLLKETTNTMLSVNNTIRGSFRNLEYQLQQNSMRATPSDLDSFSQQAYSGSVHVGLKKIKITAGAEYLFRRSGEKYLGQLTGLETTVKGIQIKAMSNIGWINKDFYPGVRKRAVQLQLQLFYFF